MRRKINLTLLVLILLIGLPYYWLLLDNRPGKAEPKPITIEQLRGLAGSIPARPPARSSSNSSRSGTSPAISSPLAKA